MKFKKGHVQETQYGHFHGPKSHHGFHGGPRGFQGVPGDSRGSHGVPGVYLEAKPKLGSNNNPNRGLPTSCSPAREDTCNDVGRKYGHKRPADQKPIDDTMNLSAPCESRALAGIHEGAPHRPRRGLGLGLGLALGLGLGPGPGPVLGLGQLLRGLSQRQVADPSSHYGYEWF